jgi:hypothetical protein
LGSLSNLQEAPRSNRGGAPFFLDFSNIRNIVAVRRYCFIGAIPVEYLSFCLCAVPGG